MLQRIADVSAVKESLAGCNPPETLSAALQDAIAGFAPLHAGLLERVRASSGDVWDVVHVSVMKINTSHKVMTAPETAD